MSDQVNQLIDKIREKATQFHSQYSSELSRNEDLEKKIKALRTEIEGKDEELATLKNQINGLKEDVASAKEQRVDQTSKTSEIDDVQIDELVKEIEYCIEQLKK
jgi:cell division septum initiation protein DivIVA